jgi:hypothetical protein
VSGGRAEDGAVVADTQTDGTAGATGAVAESADELEFAGGHALRITAHDERRRMTLKKPRLWNWFTRSSLQDDTTVTFARGNHGLPAGFPGGTLSYRHDLVNSHF